MVVTEGAKDDEFGVSGIAIEPCCIVDPTPPACSEADAQLTPPAAVMLGCTRRRETTTPANLRGRAIQEYLIHLKEETLVNDASLKLIRTCYIGIVRCYMEA